MKYDWRKSFKNFIDIYHDDLPNVGVIDGEMDAWLNFWKSYEQGMPSNVSMTLQAIKCFSSSFPNVTVALRILATLPITSCECERSFSKLKRLKTYCRSTMGENRLNGLAMLYIHQEILPDFEEVINMFSRLGPRRIEFL